MSSIEENKQIARDFFKALGALNVEGLMKVISEDIVFNVPNIGCMGGSLTLPELPEVAGILGAACPEGIRFDVLDLTAEDDRISCRVNGFGKLADGGEYNNRYHFLFKIKDGKICETFEYLDSLLVENIFSSMMKK